MRRGQRERLAAHGVSLETRRIERIDHEQGRVRAIQFSGAGRAAPDQMPCDAIFFSAPQDQQCELARRLGCEFTAKGTVRTDLLGRTCVAGLFVVGDASRDVQFVVVAAAEGAKAGVAINQVLQTRAGLITREQR